MSVGVIIFVSIAVVCLTLAWWLDYIASKEYVDLVEEYDVIDDD